NTPPCSCASSASCCATWKSIRTARTREDEGRRPGRFRVSQTDAGIIVRVGTRGRHPVAPGGLQEAGGRPVLVEAEPRPLSTALAELSESLLNAPSEQLPQVFERSLESLARALGVDRCTIAEFGQEGRSLLRTSEFAMPGVPPWPGVDVSALAPWYTEQLRQGRPLVLRHLPEGLPPEATAELEFVAATGLKSHLALPLKAEGVVLGGLGVST